MAITRRSFLAALGVMGVTGIPVGRSRSLAAEPPLPLDIAVQSPWMANQVALTSNNVLFLGLPRYSPDHSTPSLARREKDGSLVPFPGNAWNQWIPGKDGRDAFVYLNSVHIFADDTVWCVDQGSLSPGLFPTAYATPQPGAQKVVQLDPASGAILNVLRFDDDILPPGAQMNDLRFHGTKMYITDSGLGAIIVHDLKSGKTLRRLSGNQVVKASPARIPDVLAHIKGNKTFVPPNSDLIEITADGEWLFWASPTGPVYKIATRFLNDPGLTDVELAAHVEPVFNNHFAGGCAMDSRGNIYFSETTTHHITLLSPSGKTAILASDPRLVRPDGSFISADRHLYIPVKQPLDNGDKAPFVIYAIALPRRYNGIDIGNAVTGK